MCHACIVESVKSNMLSRRSLFSGATAGAAALAMGAAAARPALAQSSGKVVDLTHPWDGDFPTFDGKPGILYEPDKILDRDGYQLWKLTIFEHSGTHVDAPLHFSADGQSVAEIPVDKLMAPLVVVDIREKAEKDADAQVTPDDLKAWIAAHGDMPENCCVAMNSGWARHLDTDKFRNADQDGTMHFPGFHVEAVQMLLEGSAVGIAVDTLSLDFGMSPDFAVHYAWLPEGRWGLECIAGLDDVPATGATLIVGAPKHRGGSGGPARVFALT